MKNWTLVIFFVALTSCNWVSDQEPLAIARVGNTTLYKSDIEGLVPNGTSKKDSTAIVTDYINRWATQKLLIEKATLNLSSEKQKSLDNLIKQYKADLYTNAYLEQLVNQEIDSVVTQEQINEYYAKNKQKFTNSSELVKLRYVNMQKGNPKEAKIKEFFFANNSAQKTALLNSTENFIDYAFNDSVWVDISQVFEKLPFINLDNKNNYIRTGNAFTYKDSLHTWFVKIKDVSAKNQITPLQYLAPTLNKVIINNKKNTLIKQVEKEITNDAIKNKDYEIYK